jgi:hypothetical protein
MFARVRVFRERRRARIARLAAVGTRLPGVVRERRSTIGVTR